MPENIIEKQNKLKNSNAKRRLLAITERASLSQGTAIAEISLEKLPLSKTPSILKMIIIVFLCN